MHLHGVRVIDLTRILSGPFCSLLLADMGAEVIKVEPPGGDPLRGQGAIVEGLSWYFAAFNRNKRSIVLNLRSAAGKEALRRLIATADVVVDNFRPGVMADLGLDEPQLSALQPGIIHTSVTGFGERGPYAHRPSFDFIAQAMSGFMSCNGTPETGPMRTGAPISDLVAGLYAALGTVAALYRLAQTGQGERVSVAMVDGLLSLGAFLTANFFATGRPYRPGTIMRSSRRMGCSLPGMGRSRLHRVTTGCMPSSSPRWISKHCASTPISARTIAACSIAPPSTR